ncbi:MAG: 5'/3'-nucleotidase SurE [Eubacteriales bacterium]|nr:5'/3'-nucleotidase SurE [Eubacteriales bacterium]
MHIMLVNDDGWHGEGLQVLAKAALAAGHRVTICAPDRQQSGAGHALSFDGALKARRLGDMSAAPGWMVNGSPADCARMGVWLLREDRPDIVISGINYGSNIGAACVYSGTVAGAMEASMAGVPASAVSLDMGGRSKNGFGPAAVITLNFMQWALEHPLKTGEIYNLNVPDLPESEIKGIRKASLSNLNLGAPHYSLHESEVSGSYYMFEMSDMPENADPDNDLDLLAQGWATVTPLTWNCVCAMDGLNI